MAFDLQAELKKAAPVLDKAKAIADKAAGIADAANAAIQKLDKSFVGTLIHLVPGAGPIVGALVTGCQLLDETVDALAALADTLDTVVDNAIVPPQG